MSQSRSSLLVCVLWGGIFASQGIAAPASQYASLSGALPPDARIFVEMRDLDAVLQTPAASALGNLLTPLVRQAAQTQPAATQPGTAPATQPTTTSAPVSRPATAPARTASRPATRPSWRRRVAHAVGIESTEAAELLLAGRLAFAADGWGSIGDAVLLAEPPDAAELEAELAPMRVAASAAGRIRQYAVSADHELACDGRLVVLGRKVHPGCLYHRTLALWIAGGPSLADLPEFRQRTGSLTSGAQVVLYADNTVRPPASLPASQPATRPATQPALTQAWPTFNTVALGLNVHPDALTVEMSGRTATTQPAAQSDGAPLQLLSRMPASTLVGWTQQVDYADEFRRLDAENPAGIPRFYLDVLQTGLPRGAVRERLLEHLVGESLFVIGQTRAPSPTRTPASPPAATAPATSTAPIAPPAGPILPTLTMLVRTDAPHDAEPILLHVSQNLLRLVNSRKLDDGPVTMRNIPLPEGGGTIHSIDIGRLFASTGGADFLASLELSWTVADTWVVVGTHPDAVRQVVRTRRGSPDSMPAGPAQDAVRQAREGGGSPLILLVAQPRSAADVLDSWVRYIRQAHPEMLQADWWHALRSRQNASRIQLGILSGHTSPGMIEVTQTIAGWPAHGRLMPGDIILGINGRLLDQHDPESSLRAIIAARGNTTHISVRVLRAGREQQVDLPMPPATQDDVAPGIRPVQFLAQLADLLRTFSSASYAIWQRSPDVLHARLELRFAR